MAIWNLHEEGQTLDTTKDRVVIKDLFESKRGGAVLDFTGFPNTVLYAGHVIIRNNTTGDFAPMPVAGSAYAALPVGYTVDGVLISTITVKTPRAGIMYRGVVNPVAAPYPFTAAQITALQSNSRFIGFHADV